MVKLWFKLLGDHNDDALSLTIKPDEHTPLDEIDVSDLLTKFLPSLFDIGGRVPSLMRLHCPKLATEVSTHHVTSSSLTSSAVAIDASYAKATTHATEETSGESPEFRVAESVRVREREEEEAHEHSNGNCTNSSAAAPPPPLPSAFPEIATDDTLPTHYTRISNQCSVEDVISFLPSKKSIIVLELLDPAPITVAATSTPRPASSSATESTPNLLTFSPEDHHEHLKVCTPSSGQVATIRESGRSTYSDIKANVTGVDVEKSSRALVNGGIGGSSHNGSRPSTITKGQHSASTAQYGRLASARGSAAPAVGVANASGGTFARSTTATASIRKMANTQPAAPGIVSTTKTAHKNDPATSSTHHALGSGSLVPRRSALTASSSTAFGTGGTTPRTHKTAATVPTAPTSSGRNASPRRIGSSSSAQQSDTTNAKKIPSNATPRTARGENSALGKKIAATMPSPSASTTAPDLATASRAGMLPPLHATPGLDPQPSEGLEDGMEADATRWPSHNALQDMPPCEDLDHSSTLRNDDAYGPTHILQGENSGRASNDLENDAKFSRSSSAAISEGPPEGSPRRHSSATANSNGSNNHLLGLRTSASSNSVRDKARPTPTCTSDQYPGEATADEPATPRTPKTRAAAATKKSDAGQSTKELSPQTATRKAKSPAPSRPAPSTATAARTSRQSSSALDNSTNHSMNTSAKRGNTGALISSRRTASNTTNPNDLSIASTASPQKSALAPSATSSTVAPLLSSTGAARIHISHQQLESVCDTYRPSFGKKTCANCNHAELSHQLKAKEKRRQKAEAARAAAAGGGGLSELDGDRNRHQTEVAPDNTLEEVSTSSAHPRGTPPPVASTSIRRTSPTRARASGHVTSPSPIRSSNAPHAPHSSGPLPRVASLSTGTTAAVPSARSQSRTGNGGDLEVSPAKAKAEAEAASLLLEKVGTTAIRSARSMVSSVVASIRSSSSSTVLKDAGASQEKKEDSGKSAGARDTTPLRKASDAAKNEKSDRETARSTPRRGTATTESNYLSSSRKNKSGTEEEEKSKPVATISTSTTTPQRRTAAETRDEHMGSSQHPPRCATPLAKPPLPRAASPRVLVSAAGGDSKNKAMPSKPTRPAGASPLRISTPTSKAAAAPASGKNASPLRTKPPLSRNETVASASSLSNLSPNLVADSSPKSATKKKKKASPAEDGAPCASPIARDSTLTFAAPVVEGQEQILVTPPSDMNIAVCTSSTEANKRSNRGEEDTIGSSGLVSPSPLQSSSHLGMPSADLLPRSASNIANGSSGGINSHTNHGALLVTPPASARRINSCLQRHIETRASRQASPSVGRCRSPTQDGESQFVGVVSEDCTPDKASADVRSIRGLSVVGESQMVDSQHVGDPTTNGASASRAASYDPYAATLVGIGADYEGSAAPSNEGSPSSRQQVDHVGPQSHSHPQSNAVAHPHHQPRQLSSGSSIVSFPLAEGMDVSMAAALLLNMPAPLSPSEEAALADKARPIRVGTHNKHRRTSRCGDEPHGCGHLTTSPVLASTSYTPPSHHELGLQFASLKSVVGGTEVAGHSDINAQYSDGYRSFGDRANSEYILSTGSFEASNNPQTHADPVNMLVSSEGGNITTAGDEESQHGPGIFDSPLGSPEQCGPPPAADLDIARRNSDDGAAASAKNDAATTTEENEFIEQRGGPLEFGSEDQPLVNDPLFGTHVISESHGDDGGLSPRASAPVSPTKGPFHTNSHGGGYLPQYGSFRHEGAGLIIRHSSRSGLRNAVSITELDAMESSRGDTAMRIPAPVPYPAIVGCIPGASDEDVDAEDHHHHETAVGSGSSFENNNCVNGIQTTSINCDDNKAGEEHNDSDRTTPLSTTDHVDLKVLHQQELAVLDAEAKRLREEAAAASLLASEAIAMYSVNNTAGIDGRAVEDFGNNKKEADNDYEEDPFGTLYEDAACEKKVDAVAVIETTTVTETAAPAPESATPPTVIVSLRECSIEGLTDLGDLLASLPPPQHQHALQSFITSDAHHTPSCLDENVESALQTQTQQPAIPTSSLPPLASPLGGGGARNERAGRVAMSRRRRTVSSSSTASATAETQAHVQAPKRSSSSLRLAWGVASEHARTAGRSLGDGSCFVEEEQERQSAATAPPADVGGNDAEKDTTKEISVPVDGTGILRVEDTHQTESTCEKTIDELISNSEQHGAGQSPSPPKPSSSEMGKKSYSPMSPLRIAPESVSVPRSENEETTVAPVNSYEIASSESAVLLSNEDPTENVPISNPNDFFQEY